MTKTLEGISPIARGLSSQVDFTLPVTPPVRIFRLSQSGEAAIESTVLDRRLLEAALMQKLMATARQRLVFQLYRTLNEDHDNARNAFRLATDQIDLYFRKGGLGEDFSLKEIYVLYEGYVAFGYREKMHSVFRRYSCRIAADPSPLSKFIRLFQSFEEGRPDASLQAEFSQEFRKPKTLFTGAGDGGALEARDLSEAMGPKYTYSVRTLANGIMSSLRHNPFVLRGPRAEGAELETDEPATILVKLWRGNAEALQWLTDEVSRVRSEANAEALQWLTDEVSRVRNEYRR